MIVFWYHKSNQCVKCYKHKDKNLAPKHLRAKTVNSRFEPTLYQSLSVPILSGNPDHSATWYYVRCQLKIDSILFDTFATVNYTRINKRFERVIFLVYKYHNSTLYREQRKAVLNGYRSTADFYQWVRTYLTYTTRSFL